MFFLSWSPSFMINGKLRVPAGLKFIIPVLYMKWLLPFAPDALLTTKLLSISSCGPTYLVWHQLCWFPKEVAFDGLFLWAAVTYLFSASLLMMLLNSSALWFSFKTALSGENYCCFKFSYPLWIPGPFVKLDCV